MITRCLWMAVLLAAPAIGADTVFYVATDGRDDNPGTRAKPFASPARAQKALRQAAQRPATVVFRAGAYALNATLRLGKEDSGTSWRAEAGEKVFLRGSAAIPPAAFTPVTDEAVRGRLPEPARSRVLVADLKALGIADYGDPVELGRRAELFLGDEPMTLARWPNEGFVKVADVVKAPQPAGKGQSGDKAAKLRLAGDRHKRWADEAASMKLFGYWFHDWADACQAVAAIDATGLITLAPPFHHYGYKKGQRAYALNLLCELDAPGEWYLDRAAGRLYFWPPPRAGAEGAAALAGADVSLSILETPLVEISDATDVRLEGLTFERTRGPAVGIAGGKGNLIVRCTIRNTGGVGVSVSGGAAHGVADSEFYRTGRGGVHLEGGDRRTLTPAGHFVTGCRFRDFARLKRTYAAAIQVGGVGNRAAHNLIHDGPHMAVGFSGNDHVLEYNDIHNVCRETGDVGVFYTGRDWTTQGIEIRYNYIHHVHGPGTYGAQGIYMDDAASGMHIHGNVLFKVQRAIQMGGGRDNTIENNLIVNCPRSLDFDNRGLGWMKDKTGPGGIMPQRLAAMPYATPPWSTRYPRLVNILNDAPGSPRGNVIRHNVLLDSGAMNLAAEVTKFGRVGDNLSAKATEPLGLANPAGGDFRLKPGAALLKKLPGFKPIPFDKIGPAPKPD